MMVQKHLRLASRIACLLASLALLTPVFGWTKAPAFIVQASPFAALCSIVALGTVSAASLIGLGVGVAAIWKKRCFCRCLCPVGLMLEGVARIGLNRTSWWRRLPPVGRGIALLTVLGATIGYPLLLWLDPLALFSNALSLTASPALKSGILSCAVFAIIVIATLLTGGLWCARLCPLGAAQDLLSGLSSLTRRKREEPFPVPTFAGGRTRRIFIFTAVGLAMSALGKKMGAARGEEAPLRPPGAVGEDRFCGICARCGACVRICPSKAIRPDFGDAGVWGALAPTMRYDIGYCREDCCLCTEACPSGALVHLDLNQKRAYVIGEALVDGALCLVALGQKECDACVGACPFDAISIEWDEQQYLSYPRVTVEKCNGCGACELACPTPGLKAITVWKKQ